MVGVSEGSCRSAFGFLTVFGRAAAPDERATRWFPVVGAVVGGAVGLAWWGAAELWPALLAAAIAVAVDAGLTGMLHLDGLADSADGLLPPMDRDRRLQVMRDPNTGAFAVVTLALVLALRVGALAAIAPEPLALAGIWAMSRTAMAVTMTAVPYARPDGLASAFVPAPKSRGGPRALGAGTVVAAVAAVASIWVATDAGHALAATAALVAGAGAVVLLARRRLGGFTGDVLGAAGVVGETVALLALAAQW